MTEESNAKTGTSNARTGTRGQHQVHVASMRRPPRLKNATAGGVSPADVVWWIMRIVFKLASAAAITVALAGGLIALSQHSWLIPTHHVAMPMLLFSAVGCIAWVVLYRLRAVDSIGWLIVCLAGLGLLLITRGQQSGAMNIGSAMLGVSGLIGFACMWRRDP